MPLIANKSLSELLSLNLTLLIAERTPHKNCLKITKFRKTKLYAISHHKFTQFSVKNRIEIRQRKQRSNTEKISVRQQY